MARAGAPVPLGGADDDDGGAGPDTGRDAFARHLEPLVPPVDVPDAALGVVAESDRLLLFAPRSIWARNLTQQTTAAVDVPALRASDTTTVLGVISAQGYLGPDPYRGPWLCVALVRDARAKTCALHAVPAQGETLQVPVFAEATAVGTSLSYVVVAGAGRVSIFHRRNFPQVVVPLFVYDDSSQDHVHAVSMGNDQIVYLLVQQGDQCVVKKVSVNRQVVPTQHLCLHNATSLAVLDVYAQGPTRVLYSGSEGVWEVQRLNREFKWLDHRAEDGPRAVCRYTYIERTNTPEGQRERTKEGWCALMRGRVRFYR